MSDRPPSFNTLMRRPPEGLPERLDLLIVGGGPAGTAAAFRARELGLAALVIEYDDVLKRIRDYSKDKLILPSFGGGDRLRFPKGGELLSRLHFEPIDKDDLHAGWKRLYVDNQVPVQIGLELTGLEHLPAGIWRATAWDHGRRIEVEFQTFAVLLAVGRGVPRRFDVPGDTDGIAYRLSDPGLYVGGPALVVGGGTSAAEAVIAISNAKIAADDPSAVFWSYRGTKLPRVSKALAEVFFSAYVGNGNIRYFPLSEPAAVVVGDDRKEYLALRIARRYLANEPCETTLLEFPKERTIACIGEDVPESFLAGLGIPLHTDADNRKRMLVSRELETIQPNVFMAGDLLSQTYVETDGFPADPALCREVKHPGNVKNALRDGVKVAQIVARRLGGAAVADAEVEDAEAASSPPEVVAAPAPPGLAPAGPPAPAMPGPEVSVRERARLVELTPAGVAAEEHPLPDAGIFTLGRHGCALSFPDDESLGETHATIENTAGGCRIKDHGSPAGTFLRARAGAVTELADGALVRAGRQFLLLVGHEVRCFDRTGRETGRWALADRPIVLGRDAPDGVLDAADPSLSRRHLSLAVKEGQVVLKDLGSVNGTYVRLRGLVELADGDEIQAGRRFFRLSLGAAARPAPAAMAPAPTRAPQPPEAARVSATGPAAGGGAPTVIFRGASGPLAVASGQTLCEAAEKHGVPLKAECHAGICGSDPIRILAGAEHCSPPGDGESDTLKDLCGLEPGPCRLACMVRISGPVEVEVVAS